MLRVGPSLKTSVTLTPLYSPCGGFFFDSEMAKDSRHLRLRAGGDLPDIELPSNGVVAFVPGGLNLTNDRQYVGCETYCVGLQRRVHPLNCAFWVGST